jgi:hypothetical protein
LAVFPQVSPDIPADIMMKLFGYHPFKFPAILGPGKVIR